MKFKVVHIMNKPIEPLDREAFASEWRKATDTLLTEKPKADDRDAWLAINDQLDELQARLGAKYPTEQTWDITAVEQLSDLVSTYGTLSICKEDDNFIIYVMDLPESQVVPAQN